MTGGKEWEVRYRLVCDAALAANRSANHHDDAYGFGSDRSANNIRLMCNCHNLYMAEPDFGKEKKDAYRRSADRVSEPAPSFEL